MLPDGTIKLSSVVGGSDIFLDPSGDIKLGSSGSGEALILGTSFKTLYDAHVHVGNLGIPTGQVLVPITTQISGKVFTEL